MVKENRFESFVVIKILKIRRYFKVMNKDECSSQIIKLKMENEEKKSESQKLIILTSLRGNQIKTPM